MSEKDNEIGYLVWVDGAYADIYSKKENAEAHADLVKRTNYESKVEIQEISSEIGVVLHLNLKHRSPLNGVIDPLGRVRIGAAGGWEFSRYLTNNEIRRITKRS